MHTVDIGALSQSVTARVAPDQVGAVEAILDAYGEDLSIVERVARKPPGGDLGFGAAELSSIAMAIVAVSAMVVNWLGTQVLDAVKEHSATKVKAFVAKMLTGRKPESRRTVELPSPLTVAQLALVRQLVVDRAPQFGADDTTARLLADAVVGALVGQP